MKKIKRSCANTLFISLIISVCCTSGTHSKDIKKEDIIRLGNSREIFIDDYLIADLKNIDLLLHSPKEEEVAFFFDKQWEGPFSTYATIIKNNNKYQAYYRGLVNNKDNVICYAESEDGISWIKPNLGIYSIAGSKNNNVILADAYPVTHNFSPFLDKNPKCPSNEKYKAIGGKDESGLIAYVSQDGIHWKPLQKDPVITKGTFDSQNVAFWSESEKQYVCYFRVWSAGNFTQKKGVRTIARSTSKDFINWTDPVMMTFGDTPMEELYTQQTAPYYRASQIYLAIGARFVPGRQVISSAQAKSLNVDSRYYNDASDVFIMSSRGGNTYNRYFMESFIRPGIGLSNWSSRSNYPALNVVQTSPSEMSIYVTQDYAQKSAHLKRYSIRIDGFSSLSGDFRGGNVITKPFTFEGKQLEINYATSAIGEIRFELQDKNGKPIKGFTLEDCDPIIGNEISRTVSWNKKSNVSTLTGKEVKLRIYLKDSNLYSLRFF